MDLLDRLLGHDAWTTRRCLDLARPLADAELDRPFALGPGSLRVTLEHVVRNVEVWTDLMAGRPPRPRPADDDAPGRTIARLTERHERAAADLAALARDVAARGAWDARWLDVLDDPPAEKTFGGAIAHVITHSMHHRAQILWMLKQLGVAGVPEGDVLSWEQRGSSA